MQNCFKNKCNCMFLFRLISTRNKKIHKYACFVYTFILIYCQSLFGKTGKASETCLLFLTDIFSFLYILNPDLGYNQDINIFLDIRNINPDYLIYSFLSGHVTSNSGSKRFVLLEKNRITNKFNASKKKKYRTLL